MQWILWVIGIILSATAGYFTYKRDLDRGTPYPWLTALLRSLVVFITIVLLIAPVITITKNTIEKPVVVLLQDNSSSIAIALGKDTTAYRKSIKDLTDRLAEHYKVVPLSFGSQMTTDSSFRFNQPVTDIATALSDVQEYYGMQDLGAVILATDGRFNQGMNPIYKQLSFHCPLYVIAIGDSALQKDIRIVKTYTNKTVLVNSNFEIRSDIVADLCKGYNNSLLLKEGNDLLATIPITINTEKFDRSFSFTIKAALLGLHHYTISLPPADSEQNKENNRKDIFVEVVDEKKNILIVSDAPHPDVNAIRDAMTDMETYKVTVCTADKLPASLSGYKVIVLHNVPSIRNNIIPQLRNAGKPLWFIFSAHADIMMYNALKELTHNNFIVTIPHDMPVTYNAAFNAFTLPQQVQAVSDKMPPLSSNAGNVSYAQNGFVLFTHKGAGVTPAWILQQGSIPYAVLLGEGLWRWRLYEYKNYGNHNITDECIRQTIGFLAAGNNEKPFTVLMPKYIWSDQETITLNAYLQNANREQVNTPDAKITITDSAGHKQDFSFERSGTSYHLNIGIWAGGTYHYTAETKIPEQDKTYTTSGSFVVERMPLELMQQGADYPLLYSLAHQYNGAFFTEKNFLPVYDSITKNEHIKPLIQTNIETAPLVDRKWYFFLILIIATTEWLLRKYWLAQ